MLRCAEPDPSGRADRSDPRRLRRRRDRHQRSQRHACPRACARIGENHPPNDQVTNDHVDRPARRSALGGKPWPGDSALRDRLHPLHLGIHRQAQGRRPEQSQRPAQHHEVHQRRPPRRRFTACSLPGRRASERRYARWIRSPPTSCARCARCSRAGRITWAARRRAVSWRSRWRNSWCAPERRSAC
jgi:hypothetical protein